MFLINGMEGNLYQRNRNISNSYYDDEDIKGKIIKLCPFGADEIVKFGLYTVPEAKGYFMVHRKCPIEKGDQIKFKNIRYSVLEIQDCWIFNRVEFKVIAVV